MLNVEIYNVLTLNEQVVEIRNIGLAQKRFRSFDCGNVYKIDVQQINYTYVDNTYKLHLNNYRRVPCSLHSCDINDNKEKIGRITEVI